ncbi:MAG: zinc-dependent metalloprotease [Bacteroidota bacterium]
MHSTITRWGIGLLLIGLLGGGCSSVQKSSKSKQAQAQKARGQEEGIKPYSKVITSQAETDEGLFDVHKIDDSYFYEISNDLLDREMLMVSRIAKTATNLGYGGEKLNTQTVRWQRKGDKILLRRVSYENTANDTLPVYESVQNSNFEPIIYSFPIKALNKDTSGVVIEVTDLFTSDVPALGLSQGARKYYQVRLLDGDRTFMEHIRSYPENIEARAVLTYTAANPPSNESTGSISLEINHSMVILPEEPMRVRKYDPRVGYFSVSTTDFGAEAQEAKSKSFITRYKLVPKDIEAYKRGELVEPVNPIVYYIDPATPKKWRPYLKQGVEDWQEAFEEAGFKNAIIAKDPPSKEENPDWSPEDVRYSVIRYFASDIRNAYGPHVHDPRSGQILESDIGWYHNIMSLLRDWYFVQTAAANPEARGQKFETEVMGELMRFVAAHEVGHTIGLPHNWGSSYAVPVDSLRSPSYTATHGTAPSIMDYARFNYIAQPGDGVEHFFPKIGEYDKWAIKWGYSYFPDAESAEDEEETLNEWTLERAGDPLYFYGRQTGNQIDPRSQREDLSDDAVEASELGIENLKRILTNLEDWTYEENEFYGEMSEIYNSLVGQYNLYIGHVARNIGGMYETPKTYNQDGPVYEMVDEDKQRRAMTFLDEEVFQTPEWMIKPEIIRNFEGAGIAYTIRQSQANGLSIALDMMRLARMIEAEAIHGDDTYTPIEFLDDVRNSVWTELSNGATIDTYRRNLQRAYLERMEYMMTNELPDIPSAWKNFFGWTDVDVSQSDIRALVREQLTTLDNEIDRGLRRTNDRASKAHLNDAKARIDNILNPDN